VAVDNQSAVLSVVRQSVVAVCHQSVVSQSAVDFVSHEFATSVTWVKEMTSPVIF
jgi:hypothetical protein